MNSIPQLKKEFVKTLKSICPYHRPSRVFSDWLELAACEMHQTVYHFEDFPKDERFDDVEAKYLRVAKNYNREELTVMRPLIHYTLMAYQCGFCDFLGEIAGQEEYLNVDNSQFFTPYTLCRLMTQVSFQNLETKVREHGGLITIGEPASGGGAMVIATAEEFYNQNIDPRAHAQFDCIDVSRDAFNMTYLQLSCLDLQAMVRHGNTLSMEMWEERPTRQLRHFDIWLKERRRMAAIEKMWSIMTNPDEFFSNKKSDSEAAPDAAEENVIDQETVEAETKTVGKENIELEQISLFDENTFINTDADKRRKKPVVKLPSLEQRQLDLFSEGQQNT